MTVTIVTAPRRWDITTRDGRDNVACEFVQELWRCGVYDGGFSRGRGWLMFGSIDNIVEDVLLDETLMPNCLIYRVAKNEKQREELHKAWMEFRKTVEKYVKYDPHYIQKDVTK